MTASARLPVALLAVLMVALALLVFASACGGGPAASPPSSPPADAVRAHVNGREVRQSAVDAVRAEARFDKRSDDAGKALAEAIDRELVRQEAARLGITADKADVDRRVAALTSQVGGEKALESVLKQAEMTQEQLTAALEFGVLRDAVQNARFPGIAASEARLHRFYERNRADLFTEPAAVHLEALMTRNQGIAANALKRIHQGYDFALVARQFSIDPELKDSGGDMGWVALATLPSPLRTAVAKLPVGGVSRAVQGPGGWYIFKIDGRRATKVIPFATVHDALAKELTRRARSAALDAWLDQARSKASITRP